MIENAYKKGDIVTVKNTTNYLECGDKLEYLQDSSDMIPHGIVRELRTGEKHRVQLANLERWEKDR